MIKVKFSKSANSYQGFSISGHAGFAEYGEDIVCAGVSSAVQLTINGITEILKINADVQVFENQIDFTLPEKAGQEAQSFIQALELHLAILSEDYPKRILLTDLEV